MTVLSEEKSEAFSIPEGFGHGFQTLTNDVELLYFHSNAYNPDYEGGLNAMDPSLSIDWPISISKRSVKDKSHKFINNTFKGFF